MVTGIYDAVVTCIAWEFDKMSKYTYDIDTTNGVANIYNDDAIKIDEVDCWDLLNKLEHDMEDRASRCIEQNKNSYDNGFKMEEV